MTYAEIKAVVDGKELSIRAQKDYAKLSEESTQKELDRFMRLNKTLFLHQETTEEIEATTVACMKMGIMPPKTVVSRTRDEDYF